ncbi:hypothetical protein ACHAXR_001506 [Thalassiosira sp. AJA248-18]
MSPPYTFKCTCGQTQIKLSQEPVTVFCCHCHSCVASCKFVDAKGDAKTSGILEDNGGSACAVFSPSAVDFTSKPDAGLGAVIVGEKGKNARCYAKCCNTLIGFNIPKTMALNFNGMYNEDGSKYQPPDPIKNWMKKHAFDPSKVPEPSYSMGPFLVICSFMMNMLNPFGAKFEELPMQVDEKEYEVVPITWE